MSPLRYTRFLLRLFLFGIAPLGTPYIHAQPQWTKVNALPSVTFTALHIRGDTLYAAGLNRIYVTADNGAHWDSSQVLAPQVDYITDVITAEAKLYAATVADGVFVSHNGGKTFQADNTGLSGLGAKNISMLAVRGDSIYAATFGAGVFVKNIGGGAWAAFNTGMPWGNVESITNDGGVLYAGAGANATLSRRTDGADTWTEIPFDAFNGEINLFLGAYRDGDVLLGAGTLGLYRSLDDGLKWEHFNPGTGLVAIGRFTRTGDRVIAMLSKVSGATFLFYTDNQGQEWHVFQPGLTGIAGYDIMHAGDRLYAACGDGLRYLAVTTGVPEPPSGKISPLGSFFPNPVSNDGVQLVSMDHPGPVSLSILDASGNAVFSVFQGDLPAGEHQFQLSFSGLPAGIYFVALTTPRGRYSKIVTVAR